jgi:single-strand DNA-binding protein
MYLNKAFVIGNLTRDPELKALPSGVKVCTFSLATNRVWKDLATGERKSAVDYHNVVVFDRQAETSGQYLRKGQTALVEGRMQTRSWDTQDGKKMYRTEIVATSVQFGPKPAGMSTTSTTSTSGAADQNSNDSALAVAPGAADSASPNNSPSSAKAGVPTDAIEYPEEEINPDDIPF